MKSSILRYEMKGKARTRPDIFRVALGPCAQCSIVRPRSKKMWPKEIALKVSLFDSSRTKSKQFKSFQKVTLMAITQFRYFPKCPSFKV